MHPIPDVDKPQLKIDDFLHLAVDSSRLPPIHWLTAKQIACLALRAAGHYQTAELKTVKVSSREYVAQTNLYGLSISGDSEQSVKAKSACEKFWRRALDKCADLSRLNFEAEYRLVGGSGDGVQIYASNETVSRARAKKEAVEKFLETQVLVSNATGKKFSMLDLSRQSAINRFNELYWVTKNFEALARDRGMGWIFATYTSPPEYHPNPLLGRCSYDASLGVKASHEYIALAWARVRATLSKRGVVASPDFYFGTRTAEVHKDGSIHWHLLIFIEPSVLEKFIEASKEHFSLKGQMKVEIGDDSRGSASSYVFKYLVKGFDAGAVNVEIPDDWEEDERREQNDLSTIRNGERVRAALKAMRIRQYQTFGVKKVMSIIRAINRIGEDEFDSLNNMTLAMVKREIWRNEFGLKYLLDHSDLVKKVAGKAIIMLVREGGQSKYGETTSKLNGISIDGIFFKTVGRYSVEKMD
ncbi:replication endonuclease [Pseudomonas chlororaphis subsp. aurantiaca]|uniref:replication endonuclease n=1 Tax=Pseudomonas chlororaphis TaxID=587753 RepID=UPI0027DBB930|nr:replication endonuclease [Pseudomonas chlororaphis]WMI99758.1 replication endonuclease [Pseudomonas chlororaphis subsp. aurantiaca]